MIIFWPKKMSIGQKKLIVHIWDALQCFHDKKLVIFSPIYVNRAIRFAGRISRTE